jgi:hypothetical protein
MGCWGEDKKWGAGAQNRTIQKRKKKPISSRNIHTEQASKESKYMQRLE